MRSGVPYYDNKPIGVIGNENELKMESNNSVDGRALRKMCDVLDQNYYTSFELLGQDTPLINGTYRDINGTLVNLNSTFDFINDTHVNIQDQIWDLKTIFPKLPEVLNKFSARLFFQWPFLKKKTYNKNCNCKPKPKPTKRPKPKPTKRTTTKRTTTKPTTTKPTTTKRTTTKPTQTKPTTTKRTTTKPTTQKPTTKPTTKNTKTPTTTTTERPTTPTTAETTTTTEPDEQATTQPPIIPPFDANITCVMLKSLTVIKALDTRTSNVLSAFLHFVKHSKDRKPWMLFSKNYTIDDAFKKILLKKLTLRLLGGECTEYNCCELKKVASEHILKAFVNFLRNKICLKQRVNNLFYNFTKTTLQGGIQNKLFADIVSVVDDVTGEISCTSSITYKYYLQCKL
ncbi:hypothetical protein WDU94_003078 [Cyamophila willieti]